MAASSRLLAAGRSTMMMQRGTFFLRRLPCILLVASFPRRLLAYASKEDEPKELGIVYPASGQSIVQSEVIDIVFDREDDVCFGMAEGLYMEVSTGKKNAVRCAEQVSGVQVQNLEPGLHPLRVVSQTTGQEKILFLLIEIASPIVFVPTYEWKPILDEQFVPGGLEIQLSLDGSNKKIAKIPEPWRIQIYVERVQAFYRSEIWRNTPIGYLEHDILAWAKQYDPDLPKLKLSYGQYLDPIHPAATALDVNLFTHRSDIVILWQDPIASKPSNTETSTKRKRKTTSTKQNSPPSYTSPKQSPQVDQALPRPSVTENEVPSASSVAASQQKKNQNDAFIHQPPKTTSFQKDEPDTP